MWRLDQLRPFLMSQYHEILNTVFINYMTETNDVKYKIISLCNLNLHQLSLAALHAWIESNIATSRNSFSMRRRAAFKLVGLTFSRLLIDSLYGLTTHTDPIVSPILLLTDFGE